MKLPVFTMAQRVSERNGEYALHGQMASLSFIDATQALGLSGVGIAGELRASSEEGAKHDFRIRLSDSTGAEVPHADVLSERHVVLDKGPDGQLGSVFWIPLDSVTLPRIDDYTFAVVIDGQDISPTLTIPVRHTPQRAAVELTSCVQDRQGKEAGEKYLIGRITMSVTAHGRSSPSEVVTVKQPCGGDFAADRLEIIVPKRYSDFLGSPVFREGVESYYRQHAITGFGGTLDGGVDNIVMEDNLIVGPPHRLVFDLPVAGSDAW